MSLPAAWRQSRYGVSAAEDGKKKGARVAGAHARGHALGVRDCKAVSGSREAICGNRAPRIETLRTPERFVDVP